MWAAVGQIVTRLAAAAGPTIQAALSSTAAKTAAQTAAQVVTKGPKVPPVAAAPLNTATQATLYPKTAFTPGGTPVPTPLASRVPLPPPPPAAPAAPAPSASQQAAQAIASNIKQQAIGSAVTMGSSLVTNTIGSVVGGYVTGDRGGQAGGRANGPVSGQLDRLGAGPAGLRVGASLDKVAKTAGNIADPTGINRGVLKGGMILADVATFGMASKAKQLGTAFTELVQATEGWGRELLESQKHLTAFNGTIAKTFAEGERREIVRDIESGRNTAGSTEGLAHAFEDLMDELQPFKDAATNTLNTIATILTGLVTTVVRYGRPIAEVVLWMQNHWPGAKHDQHDLPPFHEFMDGLESWLPPDPRAR